MKRHFALFLKLFGIGLTIEEKIARAEKKYSGRALVTEILGIEGLGFSDVKCDDPNMLERYYCRMVDLCAKYKVDWVIEC